MMEQDSAFSISCCACNKPAANVSFATRPQFGLAIAQRGFLGEFFAAVLGRQNASAELFAEIRDLARKDLSALYALDSDFFGFICRRCGAAYCRECWKNVYPVFDDGYYDETRGTCPRGHEQMLQD